MLISGSPSFDQRLLVHVLKTLPDIDLEVRTENRSGGFYNPGSIPFTPDSQDAFIFLDYPTARSDNTPLNSAVTHIRNQQAPLFLILNDEVSLKRLSALSEFLPIEDNSGIVADRNVVPELTPLGLLHPATQIVEDPQDLLNFWRNLPPVTAYSGQLRLKTDASVLVKSENSGNTAGVPLLVAGFRNSIKMLLFPVSGFGSWHFQLLDDADREQFFRMFMENSIRWLMNREDLEKIQIAPGKPVYQLGEYIEFSGQVFDDFYREINDAEVQLEIRGEEYQLKDIIPYMDGYYVYRTAGIPSGSYSYLITAQKSGRQIGQRSGRFVMEELELEMQETAANIQLMKELASRSGGEHWSVQQFLKASETFRYRSQVQFVNREEVLWNKLYWLIIVIILLSVEWFFRKRWGLL